MISTLQYFVPVMVGLVLHWTYFIHGEKDLLAATIARKHILAGAIIMYLKYQYEGLPVIQAIYELINLSSISIYRLLLSPLCGIPGPLGMRISKLTHVWALMDPRKQNFDELHRLRRKYGNVVRTGPNEVTLFGYDAYHKVHGPESNCGRSTYYDILLGARQARRKHQGKNLHTQDNNCDRKNIIGLVLSYAMKHGGVEKNWNFVLGDFVLVVAAGSDPVRLVLSNAVYYLLRNPEHLAKVRQELSSIDIFDYNSLQSLQHLTACIYETLRLHPAVPSAGLRMAPEQGVTINGVFIPGGTTLVTPQYSLHRDEDCFLEPNEWIPERFTTKAELILNKNAFVPWSIGKMSCLGKNLSMMEIRVALALLLTYFNIHLAPGEDGTELFSHATDFFTTTPGAFNVLLKSHMPLTK